MGWLASIPKPRRHRHRTTTANQKGCCRQPTILLTAEKNIICQAAGPFLARNASSLTAITESGGPPILVAIILFLGRRPPRGSPVTVMWVGAKSPVPRVELEVPVAEAVFLWFIIGCRKLDSVDLASIQAALSKVSGRIVAMICRVRGDRERHFGIWNLKGAIKLFPFLLLQFCFYYLLQFFLTSSKSRDSLVRLFEYRKSKSVSNYGSTY